MRSQVEAGSHASGTQVRLNRHTVRAIRAHFPATLRACPASPSNLAIYVSFHRLAKSRGRSRDWLTGNMGWWGGRSCRIWGWERPLSGIDVG